MSSETGYAVCLLYGCLDVHRYYRGDAYVLCHHNRNCLVGPNKLVASAIAAIAIEFVPAQAAKASTQSMSAFGQKRTFIRLRPISALPPKADIETRSCDVRFVPEADIRGSLAK